MAAAKAVTVRYWAGARAAAGTDRDEVQPPGPTVAAVLEEVAVRRPQLRPVLQVASILVDGRAARPEDPVAAGETIEVLPPFAGG